MKNSESNKNIFALYPVIGLAVLLLLSPCKVKGAIQAELGLVETEVSNKNQTTLSSSNCSTFEFNTETLTPTKFSVEYLTAIPAGNFDFTFNEFDLSEKSEDLSLTRNHSVSLIPLYILYQNFKVHLS